jgi:hypothetical protein
VLDRTRVRSVFFVEDLSHEQTSQLRGKFRGSSQSQDSLTGAVLQGTSPLPLFKEQQHRPFTSSLKDGRIALPENNISATLIAFIQLQNNGNRRVTGRL